MRLTTYHPCSAERQEIRGLNLPGSPWAISTACCGRDLYLYLTSTVVAIGHAIACTVGLRVDSVAFADDVQASCSLRFIYS